MDDVQRGVSDRDLDHHQYLLRYPNGTGLIHSRSFVRYRVGVRDSGTPAIFRTDVNGCSTGQPVKPTTTRWLRLPHNDEEFNDVSQACKFVTLLSQRPDLVELNAIEVHSGFDDAKRLIWTVIFMPIDPDRVHKHAERVRGKNPSFTDNPTK